MNNWHTNLPRPIVLLDGRKPIALVAAGELITTFKSLRQDAALEHAIELLMQAAKTGKREDIAAAAAHIEIVLRMRRIMAEMIAEANAGRPHSTGTKFSCRSPHFSQQ